MTPQMGSIKLHYSVLRKLSLAIPEQAEPNMDFSKQDEHQDLSKIHSPAQFERAFFGFKKIPHMRINQTNQTTQLLSLLIFYLRPC